MGRHKAIYQCFAPNPSQDHSVRGQAPHEVPTRDGKGPGVLVLDGSSHSAASWPFWGHCSSAVLLEESASQSATGNLKSGVLPKWGQLKHKGKKSTVRKKEAYSVSQARAGQFGRSAISQQKGPREGTALLAPIVTGFLLSHKHSGLSPTSWKSPVCGEGSAEARVWR